MPITLGHPRTSSQLLKNGQSNNIDSYNISTKFISIVHPKLHHGVFVLSVVVGGVVLFRRCERKHELIIRSAIGLINSTIFF